MNRPTWPAVVAVCLCAACDNTGEPEIRLPEMTAVTAGFHHACALSARGVAWCWGGNSQGQLGRSASGSDPRPVEGGIIFTDLSAGAYHTCGVTTSLELYCWGGGRAGDTNHGQLGNGEIELAPVPQRIESLHRFVTVSAGYAHTCALTDSAEAYCWGLNSTGQLGLGIDTITATTPAEVLTDSSFRIVSTGRDHTCALTALSRPGCWGSNMLGELGVEATETEEDCGEFAPSPCSRTPVFLAGSGFLIAVGGGHTCVATSAGEVICWGKNTNGQAGPNLGTTVLPQPISPIPPVEALEAGDQHTCGLSSVGEVQCWGNNSMGQLGRHAPNENCGSNRSCSSVPAPVEGLAPAFSVGTGSGFTCAVVVEGDVYCWGNNASGQLGVPRDSTPSCGTSDDCSAKPVRVEAF